MRIADVRDREVFDRNFAARRPRFAVNPRGGGTCAETYHFLVNLHAAMSDTAQLAPVATAYRALYMG
jgi:hypothetical protein